MGIAYKWIGITYRLESAPHQYFRQIFLHFWQKKTVEKLCISELFRIFVLSFGTEGMRG